MGNLSKKSRFGFNLDSRLCVRPFESIFQRQYLLKLVDVGTELLLWLFFFFFRFFMLNFKVIQGPLLNLSETLIRYVTEIMGESNFFSLTVLDSQ